MQQSHMSISRDMPFLHQPVDIKYSIIISTAPHLVVFNVIIYICKLLYTSSQNSAKSNSLTYFPSMKMYYYIHKFIPTSLKHIPKCQN